MNDGKKFEIVLDAENGMDIEFPMYLSCYEYALKNIIEKILQNQNRKDGKQTAFYREENTNIFSFVGERGTGKSTAMENFCKILNNRNDNYREKWLDRIKIDEKTKSFVLEKKIKFEVLPSIDASLLEEREDLFELILANMFEKCDNKRSIDVYGYDKNNISTYHELSRKFGSVYHNHRSLKYIRDQEDFGESVISKLRAMPTSMKTQREFDELINLFFETLGIDDKENASYLVVVIDDLDLNINHGFEMLEQLHKYLSHPQVLILTALSYEQLSVITENHFKRSLRDSTGSCDPDENAWIGAHCRKLAQDYLDKVIPVGHRIYMPNLSRISGKTAVKEDNAENVLAKKYVHQRIAENMKIYYDGNGTKRHFGELNTVRTLVSYLQFLDSLNEVDFSGCEIMRGKADEEPEGKKNQSEIMRIYDQNHEWFNRDIQERMAYEKLEVKQRTFFKQLLEIDLGRRARYMLIFQKNWRKGMPLDAYIEDEPYCYGDLLECIYRWGRDNYNDKPLIHCILASFTSEMVREELNYMYNCVKSRREVSFIRLENFIGRSIGNKWTGEMLPVMIENPLDAEENMMYFAFSEMMYLRALNKEVHLGQMKGRKSVKGKTALNKYIIEFSDEFARLLEDKQIIPMLECIELLSDNCRMGDQGKKHLSYRFNIISTRENRREFGIQIEIASETADFDIFAFVKKSLYPLAEHQRFLEELAIQFTDALYKYLQKDLEELSMFQIELDDKDWDIINKEMIDCVYRQSIFRKYSLHQECVAFPFFDLDVAYNIIKRVRSRCKNEFINPIDANEIARGIARIYGYIEDELAGQERFYNHGSESYRYKEIFSEYPFVKAMKELQVNTIFKELLRVLFKSSSFMHTNEVDVEE